MQDFANQLISDYTAGQIQASPGASEYLLSLLREMGLLKEAVQLWSWLVDNGRLNIDIDFGTYGTALEVLCDARLGLAELEKMYQNALKRLFSSSQAASLHDSSIAITPDGAEKGWGSLIPQRLLKGIMYARLRNNDWRNAYLALDT